MIRKVLYVEPQCEEIHSLAAALLCTSPGTGESEGVDYEDWGFVV